MIKKTITYTDFNGNERTEEHYFHLNKAELTEMELSREGGMSEYYKRIVAAQNVPELAAVFKEMILKSYGVKSEDGRGFIKFDENGNSLAKKFEQTEAYSELYTSLITDTDAATEFFNGIVPKENKPSLSVVPPEA